MESIVGSAALDAIAQQDAAEKQAIDTKATSALNTANEVAGQFITVKAAAEAATATATNAYTAAQTANAAASSAQAQALANRQSIVAEANTRGQADITLQSQITDIVNGTTVVSKASNDADGNDIPTTYVTKAELAPVATSGDYDDLTDKPTAGTNIEISVNNVISAPNVPAKTEAVGSFTLSLDPQTYELSIQAKDINGTNIGTAQTVDLPIETMVVSGSYDDATKSITLTLQNGQTITFSVAGLVAGLQTQLTFDSTPTNESTNPVTSGGVYSALANKQSTLTFDAAPTQNSSNPVTSGGVYTALAGKQNTLTFDATPTQNSSNPVTSGGVYSAFTKYGKIYKDLDTLNTDKGTSIELVSGTDNCSKIVSALDANEVFSDYFNNYTASSKWGIGSSSGTSYVLIRFEKLANSYCIISAYETDTNTEYFRVSKNGTLDTWQINAKQTDLDSYMPTKKFSSPDNITQYIKIESNDTFGGILLAFSYGSMYFISSPGVTNLTDYDYGLTGVAFSTDKKIIWLRIAGWRMFTITNLSKYPYTTISDATTTAPSGYTFTTNWKQVVTTIPGVNDHVQYYIPSTSYAVLATTSGSNVDYYFGTYGASDLVNLVNPSTIYTDIRLEDGKFMFACELNADNYENAVGTRLWGRIAVGRKFFVDALNIMLDKSFTYSQFSSWANANNYKIAIGDGTVKFSGEPGVEDLVAQTRYNTDDITFNFGNSYKIGGITHYNGVTLPMQGFVIQTITHGIHTSGNDTGAGRMKCTVDLSGFIAQYS